MRRSFPECLRNNGTGAVVNIQLEGQISARPISVCDVTGDKLH